MLITKKVVAGFLDGDGTICISGNTATVAISQSGAHAEDLLKRFGELHMGNYCISGPQKGCYQITWRGWNALDILWTVRDYGVIKAWVAELALAYLSDREFRDGWGAQIREFNREPVPKTRFRDYLQFERICDEWIGGIFAAEGSLCRKPPSISFKLDIAQKSHPEVLETLILYFGTGYLSTGQVCYTATDAKSVIYIARRIHQFALHKEQRLQDALEMYKLSSSKHLVDMSMESLDKFF